MASLGGDLVREAEANLREAEKSSMTSMIREELFDRPIRGG